MSSANAWRLRAARALLLLPATALATPFVLVLALVLARAAAVASVARDGGYACSDGGRWLSAPWGQVRNPTPSFLRPIDRVEWYDSNSCSLGGIGALREVRSIHCRECNLNDTGLRPIVAFQKLESLALNRVHVTDAGLAHLRRCRRLESLDVIECPISDAGLKSLAGLPLHWLRLDRTEVGDEGLEHLAGLPLEFLCLQETRITDAGLKHLAGMPLRYLQLDGTDITDAGLRQFSALPLTHLSIRETRISRRAIQILESMSGLEDLVCSSPPFCTEDLKRLRDRGCDVTLVDERLFTEESCQWPRKPVSEVVCCFGDPPGPWSWLWW